MSNWKAHLEIGVLALFGSSLAFATNVEVSSTFIKGANQISYAMPDAAMRTQLNNCFRNGNCVRTPPGEIRNYPAVDSRGNLFSGCYIMQGADLRRVQDLDADGGCGADPTGRLKVFVGYRMDCPGGAASCTSGGTLRLGCSLESMGAQGTGTPFPPGFKECVGGAPIVVDAMARSLASGGGGGSTPPPSSPGQDPANCRGEIHFTNIIKPAMDGSATGNFRAKLYHTQTNQPINWSNYQFSPTAGSVENETAFTRHFKALSAGTYTVSVDYVGDADTACRTTGVIELTREVCDAGYQPNVAGTACVRCPSGLFKNAVGDSACAACPPVSVPNATVEPWVQMATQPVQGATSVNDCRPNNVTCQDGFVYNSILKACETQPGCGWSIALAPKTDETNAYYCYGYALVNPDPGGFWIPDNGAPRSYGDSSFKLRLKPNSPSTPIQLPLTFSGNAVFTATGGSQKGSPVALPGGEYVVEFSGISKGDFEITARDAANCAQSATVSIPASYDSCSNFTCPAGTSQFLFVLPGKNEANSKNGLPNYISDVTTPAWMTDLNTELVGKSCHPGGTATFTGIFDDTARPRLERLGYRISMPPAVNPYIHTNNYDNGNQQNMAGQCILSETGTNVVRFVQRACVPHCANLPLGELSVSKRPTQCAFDGKTYYKAPGSTCN